jgi:hypothetical protein
MPTDLEKLLEAAKLHAFSADEKEQHRRSFAFGNTNIENSRVTRELIDREAVKLAEEQTIQTGR